MSTDLKVPSFIPEIWGGIECSINRVCDTYFDQLDYCGHYTRERDITQLAQLGIRTLRYPILWEKHQPSPSIPIDWMWAEKQLNQLSDCNITPIVGLVHHGSGPRHTSLLHDSFATELAAYALEVAKKFPWVEYYTPVNEPLTTARFSGLYGIWYPHQHDDESFIAALLNQLKGIVLSMQAIRSVNANAKLVQTEDLGKTYSTPLLKYQADFENERRWLTYDILCGRLIPGHALWDYFIKHGTSEKCLNFFQENPCPPAIAGFNHYLTSERYLDECLERYPTSTHGGNKQHSYADVEAIRVAHQEPQGLYHLLKEAWDRYNLPMAITEVQLNCSREEQMRWIKEVWDITIRLNKERVDIRAITPWALLGSYGWNTLLTQPQGDYEAGVFDVSKSTLRKTMLYSMIQSISKGIAFTHPLLKTPAWWQRPIRFINQPPIDPIPFDKDIPHILILGNNESLNNVISKLCELRGIPHYIFCSNHMECDFEMHAVLKTHRPWAIINTVGYDREEEADTAWFNALAVTCHEKNIRLMTFVSPMIPHVDTTAYWENTFKAKANTLVIRTNALFTFFDMYPSMKQHTVKEIQYIINTALDLMIDEESGLWDITETGHCSEALYNHPITSSATLI